MKTQRTTPSRAVRLSLQTASSMRLQPMDAHWPMPLRRQRARGFSPREVSHVGEEERPLVPAVSRRALVALAGILALMENAPLTLGFTPEGRLQVKAPSLFFTSRLLEGRFPPWKEVLPEPSKTALKVLDPGRLQKALKEAFQLTVQGNRATELRLAGARLGIVVQNDTASFRTDIVVQNLSEGAGEGGLGLHRPELSPPLPGPSEGAVCSPVSAGERPAPRL